MEKEKKGIRCSYAVLVIILFAALCFVTDYAYIQNKVHKCSCPDCSLSGNTNAVEDDATIIENNTGNVVMSNDDIAGLYVGDVDYSIKLYIYTDGTYYYHNGTFIDGGELGNYTLSNGYINLYRTFSHGSDIGRGLSFSKKTLNIIDNDNIIDDDPSYLQGISDYNNVNQVKLTKQEKYDDSSNENSKYKQVLSIGELYNNYKND